MGHFLKDNWMYLDEKLVLAHGLNGYMAADRTAMKGQLCWLDSSQTLLSEGEEEVPDES